MWLGTAKLPTQTSLVSPFGLHPSFILESLFVYFCFAFLFFVKSNNLSCSKPEGDHSGMLEITACPVSLPSFLNGSRFESLLCDLLDQSYYLFFSLKKNVCV